MISAFAHLARLGRAGIVFAREGVLALPDPAPLPWPARTALKLARLIERPSSASAQGRLAAALTRLGATVHVDHGYPVRLIGPNRPGVQQTKWVTRLVVS